MRRRATPLEGISPWAAATLALGLSTTGCYDVSTDGSDTVLHFAWWIRALAVATPTVPIVALLLVAWRVKITWVRVLACFGVLPFGGCGVLMAPNIVVDHVVLSDAGVRQTTGFWFAPTRKGFDYADVRRLRVERQGNQQVWVLMRSDGATEVLDPGDLLEAAGTDVVLPEVERHGIDVDR